MIEVHDLHKAFGAVKAVNGVSFAARDGEITGLLGPNGAGKTTTLRMLYTLSILINAVDHQTQKLFTYGLGVCTEETFSVPPGQIDAFHSRRLDSLPPQILADSTARDLGSAGRSFRP